MAENKKTYYQISFTGAQALSAILVVLVGLSASYFLGAKAGFQNQKTSDMVAVPAEALPKPAPTRTDIAPISSSAKPSASAGSSTSVTASPAPAASPAAPSTEEAQVFEDREAGVSGESKPEKAPSRTELAPPAGKGAKAAPPAPAPTPSPAAPKPAAKPAGFFVQVLSTPSKEEATRWKGKLAAKKYTVSLSMVDGKNGKMYRLRLGPYPEKEQAKKIAAKISAEFKRQAWVGPEE